MWIVAHSGEHRPSKQQIPGSIPCRGTFLKIEANFVISSAPTYVSSQEPVKKTGHGETA